MLFFELVLFLGDEDVGVELVALSVHKSFNGISHLLYQELIELRIEMITLVLA